MKLGFVAFTRRGWELLNHISDEIEIMGGHTVTMRKVKCSALGEISEKREVSECIGEWLKELDCIVFIGACGIAVRLMAPFVDNKIYDPAVVVIDEKAEFCISLLSGHIGGGNYITKYISSIIGSVPVITTATDVNNKFSVDTFAVKNNMFITDMKIAKKISAEVIDGKKVGMVSDFNIEGTIPNEIDASGDTCKSGFAVTIDRTNNKFEETLILNPCIVTVGIGCRKGSSSEKIEHSVISCLDDMNISINSIEKVSSIDIKKDEKGILDFCNKYKLNFYTFSAEELALAEGKFNESEFVKQTTGVGSVCERSAVICSGGKLIMNKRVFEGVTVAIAVKDWSVRFGD